MTPLTDGELHTSEAIYCDAGKHLGMYRIDLRASVYVTPEQLAELADKGVILCINDQHVP